MYVYKEKPMNQLIATLSFKGKTLSCNKLVN